MFRLGGSDDEFGLNLSKRRVSEAQLYPLWAVLVLQKEAWQAADATAQPDKNVDQFQAKIQRVVSPH